jgi:hypothetical protein
MRVWGWIVIAWLVAGCAVQRSQLAQDAQVKMVGMTKEQVLQCTGPAAQRMTEGNSEFWSYNSGAGRTTVYSSSQANPRGQL